MFSYLFDNQAAAPEGVEVAEAAATDTQLAEFA